MKTSLMRFPGALKRDPSVETWLQFHRGELGALAQQWFEVMRQCGDDVREILHDGHPTALVGDAAFAYVDDFTAHVNVGFFHGAHLSDPKRLLEGTGKKMRHVKLKPGHKFDESALTQLIAAACAEMRACVAAEARLTAAEKKS